jgi:hypothetical protein
MRKDGEDWIVLFALAIGAGVAAALFLSIVGGWLIR